ncbi:MAG: hypothetical protein QOG79_6535 [Mycobacterium sp.]|jgi:hypothetical protein|nr:hypothetical protein [Mycobacterium sp.]MDT5303293.1 hypothetical protein [Mycobacterium sp.]
MTADRRRTAVRETSNLLGPRARNVVRFDMLAVAVLLAAGIVAAPPAAAEPTACDVPSCTPGIAPGAVIGAPCDSTTYYVFATTSWGRLVFCGSPRRFAPRYFRSPSMAGIKELDSNCVGYDNNVAQAPDGMFLTCIATNGQSLWVRGDT